MLVLTLCVLHNYVEKKFLPPRRVVLYVHTNNIFRLKETPTKLKRNNITDECKKQEWNMRHTLVSHAIGMAISMIL